MTASREGRRRVAVLGCTGSVGTQTLEVIRRHSDRLCATALVCRASREALAAQIAEFRPAFAGMTDESAGRGFEAPAGTEVCLGGSALEEAVCREDVDVVVVAATGLCALDATLAAIDCGKTVAFASKEILVAAGRLVMDRVREKGVRFLPVDSEHSAVFQCLQGNEHNPVRRIILTASGGAFRDLSYAEMGRLRAADALKHPTWNMGRKITVDCATMVNKGLEVIEAKWLFGLAPERVDCLLHRQSIVHSMVEFVDGAVMAQLSKPSMELPIQYALLYPERIACTEPLDFAKLSKLTFEEIDEKKYPSFALAKACLARGGSSPLVFNAANEIAVEAFLRDEIGYHEMFRVLDAACAHFDCAVICEPERVYYIDGEVKAFCRQMIDNGVMV